MDSTLVTLEDRELAEVRGGWGHGGEHGFNHGGYGFGHDGFGFHHFGFHRFGFHRFGFGFGGFGRDFDDRPVYGADDCD